MLCRKELVTEFSITRRLSGLLCIHVHHTLLVIRRSTIHWKTAMRIANGKPETVLSPIPHCTTHLHHQPLPVVPTSLPNDPTSPHGARLFDPAPQGWRICGSINVWPREKQVEWRTGCTPKSFFKKLLRWYCHYHKFFSLLIVIAYRYFSLHQWFSLIIMLLSRASSLVTREFLPRRGNVLILDAVAPVTDNSGEKTGVKLDTVGEGLEATRVTFCNFWWYSVYQNKTLQNHIIC